MPEPINNDIKTILQNDESLQGLDFTALRREGLLHLGKLSGKIWTDHNTHDPGVTILEVLIYALIDLGYRTRLPIEDLLALPANAAKEDDNFLTPLQALTCNPATITDYRKLLMEIEGVRNAWLEPADRQEVPLYVSEEDPGNLTCIMPSSEKENFKICEIKLNGLYKVIIEKELEADGDLIFEKAVELLSAHRNLCEDFLDITMLCNEQIGVCAEVELREGADAEQVYEEILKRLRDFISPTVPRRTLQEMLDMGRSIEEIFAGRPYSEQSLGFVDTEELEGLSLRKQFRLSDIYSVMMEVEGVRTVRGLKLRAQPENGTLVEKDDWTLQLSQDHAPLFSIEMTCLHLTSSGSAVNVNKEKVHRLLSTGKPHQLAMRDLDLPVPLGRHLNDLGDYWSIQNDFPLVYGIGEGGLAANAPKLRQAQALQLKGYLLFFDQVLADYLAQLANLRSLFSRSPESKRTANGRHTYFSQQLSSVPAVEKLVRFLTEKYHNLSPGIAFATPVNDSASLSAQLVSLKEELDGTLVLDNLCEEGIGVPQVSFPTAFRRDAMLSKVLRDFRQGDVSVEIWQDETGYFFLLRMTEANGLLFIGTRRFDTDTDAREAANLAIFLGGMAPNYQLASNGNLSNGDLDYFFTLSFNPINYVGYLQQLTEGGTDYLRRRERFLDHLLARFSEQFNDYALLMYGAGLEDKNRQEDRIKAKSLFLSEADSLSRNRGKAFDYLQPSWGTDNVSGLEKRAALLAGIPNPARRTLCNFEVVKCDDQFTVVLTDFENKAIFTDQTAYKTHAAAASAANDWLKKFRSPAFYPAFERSNGSRQAAILRRLFLSEPGQEEISVADWNWFLEVKNAADIVVRTSKKKDYPSENEAVKAIPELIPKFSEVTEGDEASDLDLVAMPDKLWLDYKDVNKEFVTISGFRWTQYDAKNQEVDKSETSFKTAAAAMTDFVGKVPLDDFISLFETGWQWQFRTGGEMMLSSTRLFGDAGSVKRDWQEAKAIGDKLKSYVTVELGSDNFRLDLTTPEGAVVARSTPVSIREITPQDYAKTWASKFGERRAFFDYLKVEGAYGYFLRQMDGKAFLQSYFLHPTVEAAMFALLDTFSEGAKINSYVKTGGGFGDPLYFWLMDETGEPLACPPGTFPDDKSQDSAILDSHEFFKNRRPPVVLTEQAEQAFWLLKDDRGKILLKSLSEYPTLQVAGKDLRRLLSGMTRQENFKIDFTGHGHLLQLINEGKPVAEHPELRILPSECEGIIGRIGKLLRQESYTILPVKTPANYRFEYWWPNSDGTPAPLFESTTKFGKKTGAENAYRAFFKDLPKLVLEKTELSSDARFVLVASENREPVAMQHHDNFGKEEFERAGKFKAWFTQLQENEALVQQGMVRSDIGQYVFRVLKKDEPFAAHPARFLTKHEAEQAKEVLCGAEIDNSYLLLCMSGGGLALEIEHLIQRQGKTVEKRKKHHFVLRRRADNQLLFLSYKGWDSVEEAKIAFFKDYLEILRLAGDPANFPSDDDPADMVKPFIIKDLEEDFIETTDGCAGATPLAIVPKAVFEEMGMEGLSVEARSYPVQCTVRRHHFALRDADRKLIFLSAKGYATREAAYAGYKKDLQNLLETVADPVSYEDGKARIGVVDFAEQVSVVVPGTKNPVALVSKEIWEELGAEGLKAAAQVFLTTQADPLAFCILDHTCENMGSCNSPAENSKEAKGYTFQFYDKTNAEIRWKSTAVYTSPEESMQHYYLFINLLSQKENCRVFCDRGEWTVGIVEVLAESESKFETPEAAWGSAIAGKDGCGTTTCELTGLRGLIEAASEDWGYFAIFDEQKNCYTYNIVGKDFSVVRLACTFETQEERDVCRKKLWLQTQDLLGKKSSHPRSLDGHQLFFGSNYPWEVDESLLKEGVKEEDVICQIMHNASAPASYILKDGLVELHEYGSGKLLAVAKIDRQASEAFVKEALKAARNYPLYCRDGCFKFRLFCPANAGDLELPQEIYQTKGSRQMASGNKAKGKFGACEAEYLWESVQCYPCAAEAWKAFEKFCELAKQEENFKPWENSDCGPFSWQVVDPQEIIGKTPNCYERRYDNLQAIERLKKCVNDEGLHLIEHILLRPRTTQECMLFDESSTEMVHNCLLDICTDKACALCWFPDPDDVCSNTGTGLKDTKNKGKDGTNSKATTTKPNPLLNCGGTDDENAKPPSIEYIPGSDPYSFWTTVILPGWTKRFRNPESRIFFENLLYREAPAGVALHILWLNPRSFCSIETKFKNWLVWQETGETGNLCEASTFSPMCDLTCRLNRLCNEEFLCPENASQESGCACLEQADDNASVRNRLSFSCNCPKEELPGQDPVRKEEQPENAQPIVVPEIIAEAETPKIISVQPIDSQKVEDAAVVEKPAVEPLSKDIPPPPTHSEEMQKPEPTAATPIESAKPINETGDPPKEALKQEPKPSKKQLKPTVKPTAQAKASAVSTVVKEAAPPPAIKGNGKNIRQRKPGYKNAIEAVADKDLRKTKSYELAIGFVENVPLPSEYEKLTAHILRYSIKQQNKDSDEQYWVLLRNATWYFLDKCVMDDGKNIPAGTEALLKKTFQAFKGNGLKMNTLKEGWDGQSLKEILNAPVVDAYEKLVDG